MLPTFSRSPAGSYRRVGENGGSRSNAQNSRFAVTTMSYAMSAPGRMSVSDQTKIRQPPAKWTADSDPVGSMTSMSSVGWPDGRDRRRGGPVVAVGLPRFRCHDCMKGTLAIASGAAGRYDSANYTSKRCTSGVDVLLHSGESAIIDGVENRYRTPIDEPGFRRLDGGSRHRCAALEVCVEYACRCGSSSADPADVRGRYRWSMMVTPSDDQ